MSSFPDIDITSLAGAFGALGHPVRLRVLLALDGAPLSPHRLQPHLDHPLSTISYHVHQLRAAELIELAEERRVGSAPEHLYRLTPRGDAARRLIRKALADRGLVDRER